MAREMMKMPRHHTTA
jgi:hypothetical protein